MDAAFAVPAGRTGRPLEMSAAMSIPGLNVNPPSKIPRTWWIVSLRRLALTRRP
jgi:hypothetical protein